MNIRLWTDGSCSPKGCGWAFVAEEDSDPKAQRSGKVFGEPNSERAELTAILNGLRWCESKGVFDPMVMTDSMFSVTKISRAMGFRCKDVRVEKHEKLIKRIASIAKGIGATFHWVKGHDFYGWNCQADRLAKRRAGVKCD